MGQKHTIKEGKSYYLTLTVTGWVDVFSRKNHRDILIDSLQFCVKYKGLNIYAYCIMTNHLHLIANTDEPYLLSDVLRDFKKYTANRILDQIQEEPESRREWMMNLFSFAGKTSKRHESYKFWKGGNHAIELQNAKFTWDKVMYIHNNPVEAGFVNHPSDWRYSSAGNYSGENDNVLEDVHCLSQPVKSIR